MQSTLTESSMRALEEGLPALSERKFKDALKTTLVLQYPPRALGVALVRAAQLELEQAGKLPSGAVMPVGQGQWWEYFGVSVEQAEDVVDQLKELLQTAKMGTR